MLAKIGIDFYKGVERQIFELDGVCICDGMVKSEIGRKNRSCGYLKVLAGEARNGRKIYVTVSLWDWRAGLASKCRKGCRVLVRGMMSVNKSENGDFLDMIGTFLSIEAEPGYAPRYSSIDDDYECGTGVDDINDGSPLQ
ncbi:MAG: hypothetical protein RSB65_08085 [Oscillospiraceae bacterium]